VRANETLRLTDATDQVETYLIEADETRIKATLIGKDGQKGPEFEIDRNPTIDRPDDMFEPMEMEGGMGMPFPGMERYPPVDMMYNRNVRPRQ